MGDEGLEQGAETSGKTVLSETGGAKSDAKCIDLEQLANDLKSQLSSKEMVRLAQLILAEQVS